MAPTLGTLDALARLQLTARRHGCEIRLVGVSPELRELIAFAGLEAVLPVEPGGEAEQREERVGVEEERDFLDPPV
jgi:anti-anti-sigma regulatory factor